MKIKIIQSKNEDNALSEDMYIDNKYAEGAYPMYECPEDATLERDITSCSRIANLMKQAYTAGVSGEEFEIITEQEDDNE